MMVLKNLSVCIIILSSIVAVMPFILYYFDLHYGDALMYSPYYDWYLGDIFWVEVILGLVILGLGLWTLRISKSVQVEKESTRGSWGSRKRKNA